MHAKIPRKLSWFILMLQDEIFSLVLLVPSNKENCNDG